MLLDDRRPTVVVRELVECPREHELWKSWSRWLVADLSRVTEAELFDSLAGSGMVLDTDAEYPQALRDDAARPALLFFRGDVTLLVGRRVAIVGTRHCTERGRSIAAGIGRDLAAAGVNVVSGLALGIDAAAHRGTLTALQHGATGRPVGIVASGLDVVYPKANGGLWKLVADSGVIISESPPGTAPDRFRFPLRNRMVAALSELVVVVESRIRGGSMITVDEALERDVPVMAVPGPVDLDASAGTNQLLRDGALVMATNDDVLATLGLSAIRRPVDRRPAVEGVDHAVLSVFDSGEPLTLDMIVNRTSPIGVNLAQCAMSLGRLEVLGWLVVDGGWFEKLPSPPDC